MTGYAGRWFGRMAPKGAKVGRRNTGVARALREVKHAEAVRRNEGGSVRQPCGHKHGRMKMSHCDILDSVVLTRQQSYDKNPSGY